MSSCAAAAAAVEVKMFKSITGSCRSPATLIIDCDTSDDEQDEQGETGFSIPAYWPTLEGQQQEEQQGCVCVSQQQQQEKHVQLFPDTKAGVVAAAGDGEEEGVDGGYLLTPEKSWGDLGVARGSDTSSGSSRSEEEQEDLKEGIWEDIGEGSSGEDEEGLAEGGWACREAGVGERLYGIVTEWVGNEGEYFPGSKGPLGDLTRSAAVSARGSRGGYYSCCPPAAGVGVKGDVVSSSSSSSSSFMLFGGTAQSILPIAVQPYGGVGVKGDVSNTSSSSSILGAFAGKAQAILPIAVQPSGAGIKGGVANSSSSSSIFGAFGGKAQSILPIAAPPSGASSPLVALQGAGSGLLNRCVGVTRGVWGSAAGALGFVRSWKRE